MRVPRILSQAFDSESKSVTFGWALAIASSAFYYLGAKDFTADLWQRMMLVSSGLVAVKAVKEGVLEHAAITNGGPDAPAAPSSPVAPAA